MMYSINLSKGTVIHKGKINIKGNRDYSCKDVVTCTNRIDCDECIFDYENKVKYKDVIKRVLD